MIFLINFKMLGMNIDCVFEFFFVLGFVFFLFILWIDFLILFFILVVFRFLWYFYCIEEV